MAKGRGGKATPAERNLPSADSRGECLSLGTAGMIVQAAIPDGPHPIDKTLEEAGLITDEERLVFREDVHRRVLAAGCHIDRDDIPNDGSSTIRFVRDTIADTAS